MKLNTAKTVLTSLIVSSTCILLFGGITPGRDNNQAKPIIRTPINDTIVSAKPVVKQDTYSH